MATYYVQTVAQGNESGSSEANAFTLATACDTVGSGDKVWVKANAAYNAQDGGTNSVFNPSTAGTATAPIVWEGYHTSIEDGGIVEIDADTNNLTYALFGAGSSVHFQVFKNFEFWGANSEGVYDSGGDNWAFKNCSSHNNGAAGFHADNGTRYENCLANNNSAEGFDADSRGLFVACVAHTNTIGFQRLNGLTICCLTYNNSDDAHAITAPSTYEYSGLVGCTIDAENADIGVDIDGDGTELLVFFNNIFHDCTDALNSAVSCGELVMIGRNLYNSVANENVNILPIDAGTGIGDRGDVVDPAQLFTDEGADDYSMHATSGALVKGLDAHWTVAFWTDYNEGAGDNPPAE